MPFPPNVYSTTKEEEGKDCLMCTEECFTWSTDYQSYFCSEECLSEMDSLVSGDS